MTITLRRVTGPVVLPTGESPTFGRIELKLSGWDRELGQLVLPGPVSGNIDGGLVDLDIWAADQGEHDLTYTGAVIWYDQGDGMAVRHSLPIKIAVPAGAGDLVFADLVVSAAPESTQADALAQCLAAASAAAGSAGSAGVHREAAALSAAQAALYDGPWLDTVTALLADTALTYTADQPSTVVAGDIVRTRAEGFAYEVAASGASDHDLTTAGGVKLYEAGQTFTTRARLVNAVARTTPIHGRTYIAGGTAYLGQSGATEISDLPGLILAPLRWKTNVDTVLNGPFLNISSGSISPPKNHIFVRQDTNLRNDATTVQIQRVVAGDDGYSNPKALRVATTINADLNQIEYAVSGELSSYSGVGTNSHTAVSGTSFKYGAAGLFGGHFQANEMFKASSATAVTALVGAEINTPAVGLDHPSSNRGYGVRFGLDVIARTNEGVANWNVDQGDNFGDAEIGTGISVRTDNVTDGYFRFGIAVRQATSNPNPIKTGIRVDTSGAYGFHASGNNTGAQFYSTGSPTYGAIFAGTYGTAAICINATQAIAMEGTGGIKMLYGSTASIWGFHSGAAERVGFDMSGTPRVRIEGNPVLGARRTGWTAATGTATRTTFYTSTVTLPQLAERVKALIDDLLAHGLIGA